VCNNATVALFIMDERQQCVYLNPAAEQLTGYTLAEVQGKALHDVVHHTRPDGSPYPLSECPIDQALPQNNQEQGEEVFVHRDGHFYPVAFTASPIREQGRPIGTVIEVRDITAQRAAAEHLRRSEERLRQAVRISNLGILDHDHTTGKLEWSPEMKQICGMGLEEEPSIEAFLERVHPEDRETVAAAIRRAHDPSGDGVYALEHRVIWPDGTIHWISRQAQTFFEGEGAARRPMRTVGAAMDLTARREAEERQRESEERFRNLADNISQLCWIADGEGWIFWYNRRWHEYTGTTPEEMEGWGWQRVHDPEKLPQVLKEWQQSIATGEPFNTEFPLRGADGIYRPFLTRAQPVKDAEGRVVRWFGTNTDISEQHAAAEALREADRRKNEFLAMLAHELRNPLAPIVNAVQVLRLRGSSDPPLQRQRAIIERQALHLARLVDDLLEISRINEGKIQLRKRRVTLASVLDAAVDTTRPHLETKGQRLEVRLPTEPIWLHADPDRLTQVFTNLLDNAAKYTGQAGQVRVNAEVAGARAEIRVRDTGVGIKPEDLPHIFDLFAQADPGLARSQGGLGIGLTMVRRLIELHDGEVAAFSEGLGWGSEFVVRLPVAAPPEDDAAPASGAELAGEVLSGCRVLVVDDNRDAADTTAELVGLWGYRVRTAPDGPSALRAAREFRPRIVLLDIGLPGMDGYEVARQLRQEPELAELFLMAVTGYGQEEDRRRALEAGFNAHLPKPVDPEQLRQVLASC